MILGRRPFCVILIRVYLISSCASLTLSCCCNSWISRHLMLANRFLLVYIFFFLYVTLFKTALQWSLVCLFSLIVSKISAVIHAFLLFLYIFFTRLSLVASFYAFFHVSHFCSISGISFIEFILFFSVKPTYFLVDFGCSTSIL